MKIKNRTFIKLCTGHFASNLGDGVGMVLIPLFVVSYYNDPIIVGLSSSIRMLPWLLFSILIGALIDKVRKDKALYYSSLFRFLLLFVLASIVVLLEVHFLVLLFFLFLVGICEVFSDNTIPSVTPLVVEDQELERANYWISQAEISGNQFVGPAIAGFIATISVSFSLFANAFLYLASSLLFRNLLQNESVKSSPSSEKRKAYIIKPFKDNLNLLFLALIAFVWNLVLSADLINALFLLTEVYELPKSYYGLTITSAGIGAVVFGHFVMDRFSDLGMKLKLSIVFALYVLSLASRVSFSSVYLFFFCFALIGLAELLLNITSLTYRQRNVANHDLAMVNSTIRTIALSGYIVGPIIGGYLTAVVGSLESLYVYIATLFLGFVFIALINIGKFENHKEELI